MFDLFKKKKNKPLFETLNIDVDFHSHILPCVDDGVKSVEDSFAILRRMQSAGYKKIVFTPHINYPQYTNDEESLRRAFELFKTSVPEDITLDITLGAEYMITEDFERWIDTHELLCFDDKRRVLIEMSYYFKSNNLQDVIFKLNMEGYRPVLAHPERYLYMADTLSKYDLYKDMGCGYQLNILSLAGVYGPDSMKILRYLLSKGYYTYMGSDTHTLSHINRMFEIKLDSKLLERLEKIDYYSLKNK
jgi:protein-tyrosine phosphatase